METAGVTLPQLDQFDEDDICSEFLASEILIVIARNESVPLASLPPYVASRESLSLWLHENGLFPGKEKPQMKLMDFGRGMHNFLCRVWERVYSHTRSHRAGLGCPLKRDSSLTFV